MNNKQNLTHAIRPCANRDLVSTRTRTVTSSDLQVSMTTSGSVEGTHNAL